MSQEILFGEYGEWINRKDLGDDKRLMDLKNNAERLMKFDNALSVCFIYFILHTKGASIVSPEIPIDPSSGDNIDTWVDVIIKLSEKFVFHWKNGELSFDGIRDTNGNYDYCADEYYPGLGDFVLPMKPFFEIPIKFFWDNVNYPYEVLAENAFKEDLKEMRELLWLVNKVLTNKKEFDNCIRERNKNKREEDEYAGDHVFWFLMNSVNKKFIESLKAEEVLSLHDQFIKGDTEESRFEEFFKCSQIKLFLEKIDLEGFSKSDLIKAQNFLREHLYKPRFIFADPRITDEKFLQTKSRLRDEYGWDIISSPEDLVNDVVEESRRDDVIDKWKKIREAAIDKFTINEMLNLKRKGQLESDKNDSYFKEVDRYTNDIKDIQPKGVAECEEELKKITCWVALDQLSKDYLSVGLFVYYALEKESKKIPDIDFSPCVIQYCRSLENELTKKLFKDFIVHFKKRETYRNDFEKKESPNFNKTKFLEGAIISGKELTLGQMGIILSDASKGIGRIVVLNELKKFTLDRFLDKQPLEKDFIAEIITINKIYRCPSAHADEKLSRTVAEACKEKLSSEIKRFVESSENKK